MKRIFSFTAIRLFLASLVWLSHAVSQADDSPSLTSPSNTSTVPPVSSAPPPPPVTAAPPPPPVIAAPPPPPVTAAPPPPPVTGASPSLPSGSSNASPGVTPSPTPAATPTTTPTSPASTPQETVAANTNPQTSSVDVNQLLNTELNNLSSSLTTELPTLLAQGPLSTSLQGTISQSVQENLPTLDKKIHQILDPAVPSLNVRVGQELASLPSQPGSKHESFYLGVDVGRETSSIRNSGVSADTLGGQVLGLSGGYAFFFRSNFFLAAELLFHYSNEKLATDVYRYVHNSTGGLAFLVGYQLYRGFFYLRSGFAGGYFTRENLQGDDADGLNFKTTRPGLQIGLGYNLNITRQARFKTEFNYVKYLNYSMVVDGNTNTFLFSENTYMVGFSYHFRRLAHAKVLYYPLQLHEPYFGIYANVPTTFHKQTQKSTVAYAVPSSPKVFNNILAGVDGGFSWLFKKRLYVGVEGFLELTDRKFSTTAEIDQFDWRNNGNLGVAVAPGFLINYSNLIYLRAGAFLGHFESLEEGASSKFNPGVFAGVGFESTITRSISLRTEYNYFKHSGFTPADERFFLGLNCRL